MYNWPYSLHAYNAKLAMKRPLIFSMLLVIFTLQSLWIKAPFFCWRCNKNTLNISLIKKKELQGQYTGTLYNHPLESIWTYKFLERTTHLWSLRTLEMVQLKWFSRLSPYMPLCQSVKFTVSYWYWFVRAYISMSNYSQHLWSLYQRLTLIALSYTLFAWSDPSWWNTGTDYKFEVPKTIKRAQAIVKEEYLSRSVGLRHVH